jgi:hypothetical protein
MLMSISMCLSYVIENAFVMGCSFDVLFVQWVDNL